MRIALLAFALLAAAAAQSAQAPVVVVTDENGVAVSSARVFLESTALPPARCQTDFSGRCHFASLAAGSYRLRVEKEGFYALVEPNVQINPGGTVEVAISHQKEVREVVDVRESPPAIDAAEVLVDDPAEDHV